MPTTSQGVEHHGNLRPTPPQSQEIYKALFWKKTSPYLPFKFNTHGSPEKMMGLNKLSTEFSWIPTGRNRLV